MSSLTIPEKFHKGMQVLLSFPKEAVDQVVRALNETPPSSSTRQLNTVVGHSSTKWSRDDVYEALRALRSLYSVYSSSEMPLDEFITNLVPALQDVAGVPFSTTQRKTVAAKFSRLLGVERVAVYARMRNLGTNGEPSFCKAKINTDLRPVFIAGEETPRGFMLIHRLQLGFHQDEGEHKDVYVVLDDEDLQSLRSAIDQAEKKARRLQANLPRIGN